jgi:hypothetical protein
MLTECLVANQNHLDVIALTYLDFPTRLGLGVWYSRIKKRKLASRIGRIYHVYPGTGEVFFLRMLLLVVNGATFFLNTGEAPKGLDATSLYSGAGTNNSKDLNRKRKTNHAPTFYRKDPRQNMGKAIGSSATAGHCRARNTTILAGTGD